MSATEAFPRFRNHSAAKRHKPDERPLGLRGMVAHHLKLKMFYAAAATRCVVWAGFCSSPPNEGACA